MIELPEPPFSGAMHFARDLAEFVKEKNLTKIVESGMGASSVFLLWALDCLEKGHLTSMDPAPWYPDVVTHPRHTFIKSRSYDAILGVAMTTAPWDMFLHDGSHNVFSQTLEYHFAWGCIRKGGWLVTDDYSINGQHAWKDFAESVGFPEDKWVTLHPLQKIQKPDEPRKDFGDLFHEAREKAFAYEKQWLASGHKLMPFFEDYEITPQEKARRQAVWEAK